MEKVAKVFDVNKKDIHSIEMSFCGREYRHPYALIITGTLDDRFPEEVVNLSTGCDSKNDFDHLK